jgi:hypothetical protein
MKKLDHRFGDDGEFWISYETFLQRFSSLHCVRLLTSEWEATQKWISLSVPPVLDYHKTKFFFTLEKTSPVVLVLSQVSWNEITVRRRLTSTSLTIDTSRAFKESTTFNYHSQCRNLAVRITFSAVRQMFAWIDPFPQI